MKKSDFTTIVPTAITVAYPRIFTDIPYSKEIFNYLKNKIEVEPYIPKDILAIELEARYKLIDRLLKNTKIKQILELAAGYSQRGLIFTEEYNYNYVELDLEEITDLKKDMINTISNMPDSLKIVSGDATNRDDVDRCKRFFNPNEKVVVINEGLLRYLDFNEKRKVAENVYSLLQEFGGKWMTCDFTPKKFIQNQNVNLPNLNKELSKTTDRNNADWRFEDEDHVRDFLNNVGFNSIEFHYFKEVKDELSSPKILNIENDEVDRFLDGALVTVISVD
jgi:O-methyltransferase involved in polyketide biosynthesis